MQEGEKNLNTYRILFLIKGIFDLLIILFGVLYMVLGQVVGGVIEDDMLRHGDPMPFNPASLFVVFGVVMAVIGLITGIPALMASSKLSRRENRSFIIVAAALNCITGILGILLCIFTILELQKPAVKEVFKS